MNFIVQMYRAFFHNDWLGWHWWRVKGCYSFNVCARCVKPGRYYPLCPNCEYRTKVDNQRYRM
jgi:hypothetical protein